MNAAEYVASIPGLIESFGPAPDKILISLTKAFIRYERELDDWEQAVERVERLNAIGHWYRRKFRDPEQWAFILEALCLTDFTPPCPQNDEDLFDALMCLQWEAMSVEMQRRLKAAGYEPLVVAEKTAAELKKRIRMSFGSYGLDQMPSLAACSEGHLEELVRVLSIGHAYPQFKERIHTILVTGEHSPPIESEV